MKISELEKYLVKNDIDDMSFVEFVENIEDKLKYDYNSTRLLTDEEEVDYEYYNDYVMEFMEFMNSSTGFNDTAEKKTVTMKNIVIAVEMSIITDITTIIIKLKQKKINFIEI